MGMNPAPDEMLTLLLNFPFIPPPHTHAPPQKNDATKPHVSGDFQF